ncbi:uncharacterized protein si:ch211-12e13.1 isoform X2 [Lampris incognitus]|uniref:uncharacterized protein si:ch211-12e13.1 isoform X2 n=1 Tax=Lampris incognitus TaxID=2546036 RepID=UPI0024B519BC|nr:uncharacterized protein si:ch211-12e13.1 isoform X2 [Lampris incognitus]
MGNAQSCIIISVSACSVFLLYAHIYRSHKTLQTNAVNYDGRLPSFGYLYFKYVINALCRKQGHLYPSNAKGKFDVAYNVLNCRLETSLLRMFCNSAGYGWDYPDSEYRDIPLCFPEILCLRLMLIILTASNFRLNPAGLVRVRQSLRTLQPIDELKKGPFILYGQVLEYRPVDAGVEVDVSLSATSHSNYLVWQSVLTLLSKSKFHRAPRPVPKDESKSQPDIPTPEEVKKVAMRIPGHSLHQLFTLPARLLGYRCHTSPSLWMLSVCLAEIEKHKGVEAIRAPISVTARFKETDSVSGKVMIKIWETAFEDGQSSGQGLSFQMEQQRTRVAHVEGLICRT